jgi:tRNA (adenine57-N1/adenine58-N1)-methyltransferase
VSVLLVRDGREFLCAPGDELQTDLGVLEVPPDVAPGDTIETHLGEPFEVKPARGPALFRHLDRTGAPMLPRDIGLVIGHLGLEAGDRVLDAGAGTGILAAFLGRLGVSVLTYERDEDFADTARGNMATAGVTDRVEVRTADVLDAQPELAAGEPFDAVTLDTEDAPAVVREAPALLAPAGGLAVYTPFVEHTRSAVEAARDAGFESIRSLETIQREMDFDERGSRPSTAGVGHTGYLTLARAPA